MIISPFGQCGCRRPLRGMRCIYINQITTAVDTIEAFWQSISFKVKWYLWINPSMRIATYLFIDSASSSGMMVWLLTLNA
jgi:hypothetical protein